MAVTCVCCASSVDWGVRLRSHPDLPICHSCLDGLSAQRDGQLQLSSGNWLVTGFEPIFKVTEVARSVAWFEGAGFEVEFHNDTYAFAHRERDLTIHLAQALAGEWAGCGAVYLHCRDADRVAAEWEHVGIVVSGPQDEDYGKREGSAEDPDGNVIRFESPIR